MLRQPEDLVGEVCSENDGFRVSVVLRNRELAGMIVYILTPSK